MSNIYSFQDAWMGRAWVMRNITSGNEKWKAVFYEKFGVETEVWPNTVSTALIRSGSSGKYFVLYFNVLTKANTIELVIGDYNMTCCGQRRTWWAYANAQADQGLRCPLTEILDIVV